MQQWVPAPLTAAQIQSRLARLVEMSEADGVVVRWSIRRRPRDRYLQVRVAVPGYDGHLATFEYEEWYERSARAWRLSAYEYEVRWQPAPAGRWAEHWHHDRFHRHCEMPGQAPGAAHFAGQPISLDLARDELRVRYANGAAALPCATLVPLDDGPRRRRAMPKKPPETGPRPTKLRRRRDTR